MKWTVKVFGKKQTLEENRAPSVQSQTRPGGWQVVRDPATGQQERVFLTQKGEKFWLQVKGHALFGEKTGLRSDTSGNTSSTDPSEGLIAEFPGKIRKILCTPGALVKKGQTLLLVEAMKMEFTVVAPIQGKVIKIYVQEGQQILPGVKFLELEG